MYIVNTIVPSRLKLNNDAIGNISAHMHAPACLQ